MRKTVIHLEEWFPMGLVQVNKSQRLPQIIFPRWPLISDQASLTTFNLTMSVPTTRPETSLWIWISSESASLQTTCLQKWTSLRRWKNDLHSWLVRNRFLQICCLALRLFNSKNRLASDSHTKIPRMEATLLERVLLTALVASVSRRPQDVSQVSLEPKQVL